VTYRLLPNFIVVSPEGTVPDEELPEDVRAAVALLMQINREGARYMATADQLLYTGPKRFIPELQARRSTIIALLGPAPQEPCRGGCGKDMPAGQMCAPCATRVAIEGRK
jgi:hypothetical protein